MRGLHSIVFSVTNRCTARCQDCPVVHENISLQSLTTEDMIEIVDVLLSLQTLRLVVFTGGEPFLLGNDLIRTVEYIAKHEISTRIVTNAYWATSKEKAMEILEQYKKAGLTEINISCDDFHQDFIPLDYIKNANDASLELGIPALIAHRRTPRNEITIERLSEFLGVKLHEYKPRKKNPKNNLYSTGKNIPIRAHIDSRSNEMLEIDENMKSWEGPCSSVMEMIVISPDKRVEICCGIARSSIKEFYIGSLEKNSLLEILDRGNRDLIVNWLALAGPSSILEFVRAKDSSINLPTSYVNRCHLCNELFTRDDVRSVLQEHAAEKSEAITVIRGILDWITEDWTASVSKIKVNIKDP